MAASHHVPRPAQITCDVLVVGAGPAGASAAYWLADAGWDVIAVEKKHFPREKTCGDGITPRAVGQLGAMGLLDDLAPFQRFDALRCVGFNKELLLEWPRHPAFPAHGYVIARSDLDAMVAGRAEKAGAQVWYGTEAIGPLPSAEKGAMGGALVKNSDEGTQSEIHASYVVVADGANSRVGRALGASRDRDLPLGLALRGYYTSPRHDEPVIESHLDIHDASGAVVPGYGWIFPMGDGRVNVGVGLLSTMDRWKNVNTTTLMRDFVAHAPASWCLSPDTACSAPTGGKLPMGHSVGPRVGLDYLLVGDAAGSINPFNGEGIAYGYETGRLAAKVIGDALRSGRPDLFAYDTELGERFATYYAVASAFVRLMGRPEAMRLIVGTGMYSRHVMSLVMRIMTNMLRDDTIAPPELAWRAVAALARRAGNRA